MAKYKETAFELDASDMHKKVFKIEKDFPGFLEYLFKNLGLRLLAKVKKLTPVDTGLLRRSWYILKPKISKNEASVEIKNNVKYALAVELGRVLKNGGFVPGRIMLLQSLRQMETEVPKVIDTEIQKFIDKHGGGK